MKQHGEQSYSKSVGFLSCLSNGLIAINIMRVVSYDAIMTALAFQNGDPSQQNPRITALGLTAPSSFYDSETAVACSIIFGVVYKAIRLLCHDSVVNSLWRTFKWVSNHSTNAADRNSNLTCTLAPRNFERTKRRRISRYHCEDNASGTRFRHSPTQMNVNVSQQTDCVAPRPRISLCNVVHKLTTITAADAITIYYQLLVLRRLSSIPLRRSWMYIFRDSNMRDQDPSCGLSDVAVASGFWRANTQSKTIIKGPLHYQQHIS